MDQKDPHIQRLLSLLPEGSLHPGFVVCRCVLKDCLPIDKSFLDWIEAHPLEKLCGEYAPGRFAWVLEQMEPLEAPVAAKGYLSLWAVSYTHLDVYKRQDLGNAGPGALADPHIAVALVVL